MTETTSRIIEAGPWRIIGMNTIADNPNVCHDLWEKKFLPRIQEVHQPNEQCRGSFGICRCAPHAPAGSFEYVAAVSAGKDTIIPPGMIAMDLPRSHYLDIPVASLADIGRAWGSINEELKKFPEWEPFCGPKGCHCDQNASFEYYPPNFQTNDPLHIYVPVKKV